MATTVHLPSLEDLREFLYAAVLALIEREGFDATHFEIAAGLSPANPDDDEGAVHGLFDAAEQPMLERQGFRAVGYDLRPEGLALEAEAAAPLPIVPNSRVGEFFEGHLPPDLQFLLCELPVLDSKLSRGTVKIQRAYAGGAEDYRVTLQRGRQGWELPA